MQGISGEGMKTKIFETPALQQMFDNARKEVYRIATLKETYDLIKSGEVGNNWYTTSTVYFKGEVRDGKPKELSDLKAFYVMGGRVVGLDGQYDGVIGGRGLGDGGHGVGVKE